MNEIVNLIIPFIACAILSVMIDKATLVLEAIMHRIPKLPDHFEWHVSYIVVLLISYLVCWQGQFSLFSYLEFEFQIEWQGWFMTALFISGGSAFVRTNFGLIEAIPVNMGGVTSIFKRFMNKKL